MCDNCDWEGLVEEIDELLGDDAAEWATETLEGIQRTVLSNEHCSPGQQSAVDNIRDAVERRQC